MTEPDGAARFPLGRVAFRIAALAFVVFIMWRVWQSVAPDLAKLTWADIVRWRPAPGLLLLSFVACVLTQFLHAFLWRRVAVDLGSPAPTPRETVHIYFISSLGRYVPGKIWQLAGMAALAARFGMAAGRAAAASIVAQVLFLATGLFLLGLALPSLRDYVRPGHILTRIDPALLSAVLIGGVILAVWLVATTPVGQGVRNAFIRMAGPRMGARLGNSVSVAEDLTVRNGAIWAAGYAASWILLGGAYVLFVHAFHPVEAGQVIVTGGIIAAAYMAGLLAIGVPAGVGVREGVMLTMLTTIGLDPSLAVMISISSRIWFTAAELVPILFIPLFPGRRAADGPALNGIL